MKKRGFRTKISINLAGFSKKLKNDWKPTKKEKLIIKKGLCRR